MFGSRRHFRGLGRLPRFGLAVLATIGAGNLVLDCEDICRGRGRRSSTKDAAVVRRDKLRGDAHLVPRLPHAPLQHVSDAEPRPDLRGSLSPLNANDEVRAMTFSSGIFASKFSNSSVIPSAKYSWSFA